MCIWDHFKDYFSVLFRFELFEFREFWKIEDNFYIISWCDIILKRRGTNLYSQFRISSVTCSSFLLVIIFLAFSSFFQLPRFLSFFFFSIQWNVSSAFCTGSNSISRVPIFRPLHLSSLMFVRFISPWPCLMTRPLVFLPSHPILLLLLLLLLCFSREFYFHVISYRWYRVSPT